eukprot:m.24752 g.24752  ORF g.24752 m.24752 type:complete len:235 (+) comp6114_c0_seq2:160-864(+)
MVSATTMASASVFTGLLMACGTLAAPGPCPSPVIVTLMNATTGGADCVEDYDAESNGRFCGAHSPNTNSRVLQTKAGNINTSNPDLYKQCALECIAKGYYGTAGIQTAYECWCSNFEGVQGYGVPSGQCNSKCADNVPCGGFCRMTLFSYTCPPAASAMTGGVIFLIAFASILVVYLAFGIGFNMKRGERGRDVIPNREMWAGLGGLIREGCLFTVGRTRRVLAAKGFASYEDL